MDEAARARLHRPVRPRAGRAVPYAVMVLWLLCFAALAAGYPPYPGIGVGDRVGFVVVGAVGGWLLHRFGSVAVAVDERGVVVRNVLTRRRLEWPQVVAVRFGPDSTFGRLDLADGTSVVTLALQTADGEHARRDAVRLATLVELHGRTERDD